MKNIVLAEAALDGVKSNPDEHDQSVWRCGTGMCYAGWTGVVDGAQWVTTAAEFPSEYVYADHMTEAELADYFTGAPHLGSYGMGPRGTLREVINQLIGAGYGSVLHRQLAKFDDKDLDRQVRHVADYAKTRLGLSHAEAGALFNGNNSLPMIEAGVKALANGESVPIAVKRERDIRDGVTLDFS